MGDWLRHRARLRDGNEAHAWGRRGEDLAHRYLQACGYRVVGRNWRTRAGGGEIDVVAMDGDTMVFVEVKTRATDYFGAPEQAVDESKRRNLLRAASEYLTVTGTDPARARFDIVSVLFGDGESVVHYRDAFAFQAYRYQPSDRESVTAPFESV